MSVPTKSVVVDDDNRLDYGLLAEIVKDCGGWVRSMSLAEGETAEAWHGDTRYTFKGRGLIDFLYAVKDSSTNKLDAAVDLCDYIEKSAKQPASVFVRDAILARARELRAQIRNEPTATERGSR